MKQTAVEWLQQQLKDVKYNPLEKNGYSIAEERLFNQAKEMEKQQQDEFSINFLHWYLNNDDIKKFSYSYEKLLRTYKKEKGL